MDIATYLKQSNLSQDEFAKRVGVTQAAVSQWLRGVNRPSPKTAISIEAATDGAVTRYALCPEVFGSAAV